LKRLLYILLLITLYSCNEVEVEEVIEKNIVRSSNYSQLIDNGDFEIVKLDNIENYSALLDKMGEIDCIGKTPLLKFEYSNINYELTGFFNNDSIYTQLGAEKVKKPIDNLGKYIETIISKPHNYKTNENKLKRGLVSLSIDKKYSISMTKKVLAHIANEFKKINDHRGKDFFEYRILYEPIDFLSIPPPPPPPK